MSFITWDAFKDIFNEWSAFLGGLTTIITSISVLYGIFASYFLWKSKQQRHKYSKVHFPQNTNDFYAYYSDVLRNAEYTIQRTTDGFNQCNPNSKRNGKILYNATCYAIKKKGVKVFIYQHIRTMHINWLDEIYRCKSLYPDNFFVFYNTSFETVGNFCVVDPSTRNTVFEFMLPGIGYFGQATDPSDYGFIHGHQEKSDKGDMLFKTIKNDEASIEITLDNIESIKKELWDERVNLKLNNPDYRLFDEEIITAINKSKNKQVQYNPKYFTQNS